MQASTIRIIEKLIDKPGSFFVTPHQKSFNEDADVVYFTGTIKEIAPDGFLYTGFRGGKLNFINFTHLIAICEEEIVAKETENSASPPETIEDAEKLLENI
jgi:hypothetical protein